MIWCDQGYQAGVVARHARWGWRWSWWAGSRAPAGFVLPRRWGVERFFAWISRARLACDFARSVWSACGMVQVAYARMLRRRLTWARAVA